MENGEEGKKRDWVWRRAERDVSGRERGKRGEEREGAFWFVRVPWRFPLASSRP